MATTFQDVKITGQEDGSGGFKDRRARLSAKPEARDQIYGTKSTDNILNPIWETGGLLWPYTPTISDNISVNYESYDPIHSNQPFMAFKNVSAKQISCSGLFTAQNQEEAQYCMAAIHFLRTVTKMYFGLGNDGSTQSQEAVNARGTPPPILLFNAHGTAMFHNVPVVVVNYTIDLPSDVDYVELATNPQPAIIRALKDDPNVVLQEPSQIVGRRTQGITAWVPTRFTITVNMVVQNSPNRWRRNFNLNDFRTGKLVKKGGWI